MATRYLDYFRALKYKLPMSGFLESLKAFFRRSVFVVRIKDGSARRAKGRVRQGFVGDCSDIAGQFEIQSGQIFGVKRANGVEIEFDSKIPRDSYQRFRNAWSYHQR